MFAISCGSDIVLQETSKEIFSTFFVASNGKFFPEKNWTDFSVTVIGWWVNTVVEALSKGQTHFTLLFEDGSWRLDVEVQNDVFILRGFDDYIDGCCVCGFSTSRQEFITALKNAISHMRECVLRVKGDVFDAITRLDKYQMTLQNIL